MARPNSELETIQDKARSAGPMPRRTRVVLRKLGPWSVFKWSLVFYLAVGVIFLVSAYLLFATLQASGVLQSVQKSLGGLNLPGSTCAVATSTSLEQDCTYPINGGWLFSHLMVWEGVMIVLWSFFNLLVTLLYNLVSDIIGGIELTLVDKR